MLMGARTKLAVLAGITMCLSWAGLAQAMIIAGGPGQSAPTNNTPPADDPGFYRVGQNGAGSVVYLGNGWVIGVGHVGAGNPTFNSTTYTAVGGSSVILTNPDNSSSDLRMYRITVPVGSGLYGQPWMPIIETSPTVGPGGTAIGSGLVQTAATTTTWYVDTTPTNWVWQEGSTFSGADTQIKGYKWLSNTKQLRWATPRIDGLYDQTVPALGNKRVIGFVTEMDNVHNSGNAAGGDSGSGYFLKVGGEWQLAGIAHAVLGFNSQPASTAMFGNQTLYSDLSIYRNQIIALVPEPASALLLGMVFCGLLATRRRR